MRNIFGALVLLLVVAGIAWGMGWISFDKTSEGNPEVILNKEKIKHDKDVAVEKVKGLIDKEAPAVTPPSNY